MKISVASDHAGFEAKNALKAYLEGKGYIVKDCGTFSEESCDYPDFAYAAAKTVATGDAEKAVLVCGTGLGVSIAANKVKGVRCALCYEENCAELARKHNNANVLAMGARVSSVDKMKKIVDVFLSTEFEGGRHQRRVDKIMKIENE